MASKTTPAATGADFRHSSATDSFVEPPRANYSVSDLFNGTTNSEGQRPLDDADVFRMESEVEWPLGPIASELITSGKAVSGRGQTKVGPVSMEAARRGKCLAQVLRDIGNLEEVVPSTGTMVTANGEFMFNASTDIEQLYCLDTVPVEWTDLKNSAKIV